MATEKGCALKETGWLGKGVRPRVSAIVVTDRSAGEIGGCVESLLGQPVPVEVFLLVDNASPDDTPQIVADYAARFEYSRHPEPRKYRTGGGQQCRSGEMSGRLYSHPEPRYAVPSAYPGVHGGLPRPQPAGGRGGTKKCVFRRPPHTSFHRQWGLLHVLLGRVLPYRLARTLYDRFSSYEHQDYRRIRSRVFPDGRGRVRPLYTVRLAGSRIVFLPDAEVLHIGGQSAYQVPFITIWQGYRGTIYHFLKHKGLIQALAVSLLLIVSAGARSAIAAVLGVAKKRHRNVARIYGTVFWNLIARNPIRTKGWRFHAATLH